ncbi:MAG: carboxylesterase/lipase family protein [Promethearchaeota archaeon]|nr:MAG: carboxylesterase/lipase family protein [Candidatus Lokiarchaeota archaeon]
MNKTDIIETNSGKVQGYIKDGIQIFKGIPYAEPPIGDLRFRPPVSKKPWNNVLNASKYGPCAYQGYTQLEEWFGKLQPESEDCLNLNIWTPAADNKKRPVMFWIHGGAFIMGSGIDPMYDGTVLAKRGDIVVVTINYRLGMLGYLYVPNKTVNVGQFDQISALKWVHDNIELFGGDPKNVTIFGESAGGYSVVTLSAMPAAKGLFHRVIAQSAPIIDPSINDIITKKLMRKFGLKRGDIEGLRKISPEKIIEGQNKYFEENPRDILALRALIDGDTIPMHPLKAFQKGECKHLDFMIGTNLNEFKLFSALDPKSFNVKESDMEKLLIGYLGTLGIDNKRSKIILDTYRKARQGKFSTDPKEIMSALITDAIFRISTIRMLEAQSPHQPNTYNYMFTWQTPALKGMLGACHALELPFVFGNLDLPDMDKFVGKNPNRALSEKMMDAWIAFARTGNPNHNKIPDWASYDMEKRTTMFFGDECKAVNASFDKERAAWDGLLEI